ncbi:hypothetical protein Q0Z83_112020 [Actinoplanes sichuanensis]|nr:hypothetical protein Q0Z83_112020 [Actinoplanes sichuanensis]
MHLAPLPPFDYSDHRSYRSEPFLDERACKKDVLHRGARTSFDKQSLRLDSLPLELMRVHLTFNMSRSAAVGASRENNQRREPRPKGLGGWRDSFGQG